MRHAGLGVMWALCNLGCFPDPTAPIDSTGDTEVSETAPIDTGSDDSRETQEADDVAAVCESSGNCTSSSPCVVIDCVNHRCVETPRVCEPIDACHEAGECRSDGTCTTPVQPNGAQCEDGKRCTAGDTCFDGSCRGGDLPADGVADFNVLWSANFGARATDLVVAGNELVMLLEFPTRDPGEDRALVDFGRTMLGGSATIGLPDGTRYGLAIARFSLRGEVQGAALIASSEAAITKSSLMLLNGDRLAVSARYNSKVFFDGYGALRTSVALHQGSSGRFFGFIWGQVRAVTTIEFEADEFEDGTNMRLFATDGDNCSAMAIVAGGKRAWVYTGDALSETLSSSDSVLLESWVLWFPACAAFPSGVRRISSEGGTLALGIYPIDDGSLLVQGLTKGGLSFGTRDSITRLIEPPSPANANFEGFVLRIQENKQAGFAMLLRDDSMVEGASAVIHGFVARKTEFVLATGLYGRASTVLMDGTTPLLPGSPAQAGQIAPRVLLASFQMDGTPNWFVTTPDEAKEPAMANISFAADGVITGGVLNGGSFGFGQAEVVLSEGGKTSALVAGWGATGRRWAGSLCRDTQSGGISPFDADDPLPIATSPASNGMIVAGVVHAPCELGFGRKQVIGEEGKVTGFLARINSADGIGCEAP